MSVVDDVLFAVGWTKSTNTLYIFSKLRVLEGVYCAKLSIVNAKASLFLLAFFPSKRGVIRKTVNFFSSYEGALVDNYKNKNNDDMEKKNYAVIFDIPKSKYLMHIAMLVYIIDCRCLFI